MRILIIGSVARLEECKLKFGDAHEYTHGASHDEVAALVEKSDVVFDFVIDSTTDVIDLYPRGSKVFLNTIYTTLKAVLSNRQDNDVRFFGFNGMPTFVNRSCLEVCLIDVTHKGELERICSHLNTDFEVVEDRVGMVTPRVICMIINEAYLTHEEGIATREDIDKAMKLGTNYPYGPFEWGQRIGLYEVLRVLLAMQAIATDDRYVISALLRAEATR